MINHYAYVRTRPSSLSSRPRSETLCAVCSPVEVKNNIKQRWWRDLVHGRDDMVGLDSSIIMSPKVRVVKQKEILCWIVGLRHLFNDVCVGCNQSINLSIYV